MNPWKKALIGIGAAAVLVVWGYLTLYAWKWFFITTTRDLPPFLSF